MGCAKSKAVEVSKTERREPVSKPREERANAEEEKKAREQVRQVKFQQTGNIEIDNILNDITFHMMMLEQAYSSLDKHLSTFKELTFTENTYLDKSILSMVYRSFSGPINEIEIIAGYPYFKFNEEKMQENTLSSWKKLLSLVKQLQNLLPNINQHLTRINSKDLEESNLQELKNAKNLHSTISNSILNMLDDIKAAQDILSKPRNQRILANKNRNPEEVLIEVMN